MTYEIGASYEFESFEPESSFKNLLTRAAPPVVTIALGAAVVGLMLRGQWPETPAAPPPAPVAAAPQPQHAVPYGALFDPAYSRLAAVSFARTGGLRVGFGSAHSAVAAAPEATPDAGAPLVVASLPQPEPRPSDFQLPAVPEVVENFPMPAPRPPGLRALQPQAPRSRVAQQPQPGPVAPAQDNRGIFERLFGAATGQSPSGPALAYAAPETDAAGSRPALVPNVTPIAPDRATAIYDISARTVILPNGTRLEAHSGLGPMLDDPRNVHVKMRGATPPATYDLTLREKLFHGVQAIRLTPVNSSVHGRVGLLAHTYMLGPNGDSNGCVSFRNYDAFLKAFMNGEVKRLQVVARSN